MPRHPTPAANVLLLVLLLGPLALGAEEWPQWRGPRLDGTSTERGLATTWQWTKDGRENVLWRYELPGAAASTPVVWGDRIFVTTTREGGSDLELLAIGRDGELLWAANADRGSARVAFGGVAHETSAASPSPVTDGAYVWVLFGTAHLAAFTAGGEPAWRVDLAERYGRPNTYFGLATTPLLLGDRLYLHLLHTDAQLVLAIDKRTGAEVWRHERSTDARAECLHAYTSVLPFASGSGEPELLLVHGADYLTAHRLDSGDEAWRFGTLNPRESYNDAYRFVASPTVGDGLVVVPTAKRGPVFGLRPTGLRGHLATDGPQVAWALERGTPDVPSPLLADGLVYLVGENGRLTVVDATTGEVAYAERLHPAQHRASPVLADGKLYVAATDGTVSVVKAGRGFEVLARNEIETRRLSASPAISDGTIYLRTYDALYAIGTPSPAADAPTGANGLPPRERRRPSVAGE